MTGVWNLNKQADGLWNVEHHDLINNTRCDCGTGDLDSPGMYKAWEAWWIDTAVVGDWVAFNGEARFVCLPPLNTKN